MGGLGLNVRIPIQPPTPRLTIFHLNLGEGRKSLLRNLFSLSKGSDVLQIAAGAVLAPTRFCLVRVFVRDMVPDRSPY